MVRSVVRLALLVLLALGLFGAGVAPAQVRDSGTSTVDLVHAGGPGQWLPARESRGKLLQRRIQIDITGASLKDALQAIARRAGLRIGYGDEVLKVPARISLRSDALTIIDALTQVLDGTGLEPFVSLSGDAVLVRGAPPLPPPGGAIIGRVTDAKTEAPLAGATLVVDGTRRSATTGNDGRYRVTELAPGTYTVRARYIGYAPKSLSVTVSAEQEAAADFVLEKSAQVLSEVVTTGTLIPTEVKALPTPITVITAEDIERQHPRRFDELIRLAVPGAVVWEPDGEGGGGSAVVSVQLRGVSSLSTSSNPKLYIDGIEVTEPSVHAIDPQSIERVEVVRGPQATAIYGSGAMGGVIQIFTKRGAGAGQRPEVEAQAALGRIESAFPESGALRQEYAGALTGRTGAASYRVGGGYSRTGEWMPEYGESVPSLHGTVRVEQGPLTVNLTGRFEQADVTIGFNSLLLATGAPFVPTVPPYQRLRNRSETYGVQLAFRPMPWWQTEVTAGIDRRPSSTLQYRPRRLTPDDTLLSINEQQDQRLTVAYHTAVTVPLAAGLSATLTAGADHFTYTSDGFAAGGALRTSPLVLAPSGYTFASRSATTNTGLFAQAQLSVRDALFFTGSVRAEDNSDFGDALNWPVSPRGGVTYVQQIGPITVKVRGSYGEAIRAPFPGAKDSVDYGIGCCVRLPNPDLRPEQQHGPDAGADLVFGRRGSLSVTYYDQTAKDFITFVTVDPVTSSSRVENLARVKNRGWEFEGTLELGPTMLHGQFAITNSHPEDLGSIRESFSLRVGQQMDQTPWHTGGVTVTASPFRRTSVTAGLAYVGERMGFDLLAFYRCAGGTGPCRATFDEYYGRYAAVTKLNLSFDQQLARGIGGYVSVEDLTNRGNRRAQFNTSGLPGRISTVGVRVRP